MAKYEVKLDKDINEALTTVSEASGTPVGEILSNYLNESLQETIVDLVVSEYKNGNLTAMKAWKLSGLSFDEFNALAKE